jgi:hydroxypyruvate isomerase
MTTNRRTFLKTTAGLAAGATLCSTAKAQVPRDQTPKNFKVSKARINQSVMGWCFNPMPTPDLASACKKIGLVAMEGIGRNHYPLVKKLGMTISLVGSHGFKKGPVDPKNHAECRKKLNDAIELCAQEGYKRVITFTGMSVKGISDEASAKNCIDVWKSVLPKAEKHGITLCLEHLNSRDDSHPMKGHPGYWGDDVDLCAELINKVGSPSLKLLFDVYHVQIMNGDVIRRIRQYKDIIGHYHTAGNPGRAELDETQEINYPAVMRAIVESGYKGYVAQEFIPTWDDKVEALRHSAMVCDV